MTFHVSRVTLHVTRQKEPACTFFPSRHHTCRRDANVYVKGAIKIILTTFVYTRDPVPIHTRDVLSDVLSDALCEAGFMFIEKLQAFCKMRNYACETACCILSFVFGSVHLVKQIIAYIFRFYYFTV